MRFLKFIFVVIIGFICIDAKENNEKRIVAAECEGFLEVPGKLNHFKRPGRILTAEPYGETYVADIGNSRILIFNQDNMFQQEILFKGKINSPLDMAVDGEGYIYVLSYLDFKLQIAKFDFDGLFLESFHLPEILKKKSPQVSSISISRNQMLYLLEDSEGIVYKLNRNGNLKGMFKIKDSQKMKSGNEFIYGSLFSKDSILFVPISNIGSIHMYSLQGKFLKSFGIKGILPGQLNFPISIAVDSKGIIYVLDKNKFTVVCFNSEGEFLGEFGGKGYRLGWFYYPNSISIGNGNLIYIAQTFKNIIQLCVTPDLVLQNNLILHQTKMQ